jgi:hypothetical protein
VVGRFLEAQTRNGESGRCTAILRVAFASFVIDPPWVARALYPTAMSHPLDGIHAKLQRADETLATLKDEVAAFLATRPYKETREVDPLTREERIRIDVVDPPLRFAVVAGEIIHHLRSAMDHLYFALPGAHAKGAFPVFSDAVKYKNSPTVQRDLNAVPAAARSMIDQMQPCVRGSEFKSHPLWVLHDLWNTDKHRLLTVVVTQPKIEHVRVGASIRFSQNLPAGRDYVMDDDAIRPDYIAKWFRQPVTRTRTITVHVAFDDAGIFWGREILETLEQLSGWVREYGILPFASHFPPAG